MSYSISVFIGNQLNTEHGEIKKYEYFEDLAKPFSTVIEGKKHSSYWVRGALEPMERKDANLAESNLLIIDADIGTDGGNAPSPYIIHRKLKQRGINHFLYTSHSHSEKANKFRCVVPYDGTYIKLELKQLMKGLLKGLGIGWVKEMGVMSQPWFTPTRDNIADDQFRFYQYHEGKPYEQKIKAESEATEEKRQEDGDTTSNEGGPEEWEANIVSGKEFHQSLLLLTYQWVNDGMNRKLAKTAARGVMNQSELVGTERWVARYEEIDRIVDKIVIGSNEVFDIEKLEVDSFDIDMPKPPGLLGDLYHAAYNYLLLQSEEVAFASAVGAVAAVIGRKFNVMEPLPAGLNIFLTIIADTGCGKDRINDFIRLCLTPPDDSAKSYSSFIAPSHFYGPKAIVDHFTNARSGISIISEGGMMMKVKSGNVEAKTAFMLDALQCSHSHGYTKAHGYSKSEDSLPSIRAMAMSVVSESTSSQMDEAWKETGALNSGYLPRQLCLRIKKPIVSSNRNIVHNLADELKNKFHDLCEKCSAIQAKTDPSAHEIRFAPGLLDDYFRYYDQYLALREEHAGHDGVKSNMASRVAQKAIRLAGIATVFNKDAESDACLLIEEREWEWAKKFCDYEYDNISTVLAGISGDQDMDNACFAVYLKLVAIADGTMKDKKCQIDARYRNKKVVPYAKLKTACKANPNINSINDRYGAMKLGLDKVLDHMAENKAVAILKKDPLGGRSTKLVQLLPGINDYKEHFGA